MSSLPGDPKYHVQVQAHVNKLENAAVWILDKLHNYWGISNVQICVWGLLAAHHYTKCYGSTQGIDSEEANVRISPQYCKPVETDLADNQHLCETEREGAGEEGANITW